MNTETPVIHDLVFATAVEILSNSYRRTIYEFREIEKNPENKAAVGEAVDLLSSFFRQVKSDGSLLKVANANDVNRLLEAYQKHPEYGPIINVRTFELVSYLGADKMDYLAKHFAKAYVLSVTNTLTPATVNPDLLATVLIQNPWLVMLLVTLFCSVREDVGA